MSVTSLVERLSAVLVVIGVVVVVGAGPAAAHADFLGSNPADGEVVAGAVESIELRFSAPVEPVESGFELLVRGVVTQPEASSSEEGAVWSLTTGEPLIGEIGVRWAVKAPDAHPISGAFSFRVAEPAPTSTQLAPPSPAPGLTTTTSPRVELSEFLDEEPASWPSRFATMGRTVSFAAAVVGPGLLLFTRQVMVGGRDRFELLFYVVRTVGLALLAGALVELIGVTSRHDDFASGVSSGEGAAVIVRIVGGACLMAAGSAGMGQLAGSRLDSWSWRPHGRALMPLVGVAGLVVSFSLDGHTLSEGWRPAMVAADVVHVAAAGVWVGGIAGLAMLRLQPRSEPGEPGEPGTAVLAAHFSWYATTALLAVAVTGSAMAFAVLDRPGEVWGTDWGRWLLVKLALVGVGAACGAYNRFVAIPAASSDGPDASERLVAVLRVEAVILVAAAAVTGLLVVAAT